MKVRAKFVCNAITKQPYNDNSIGVFMNAVYSSTGENADFAKATPWGILHMGVDVDTMAAKVLETGKTYYITIEEAPEN